MYPQGVYVMHRSEGVCQVEDIRTERFSPTEPQPYYILRPIYEYGSTTVFLPTAAEEKRLRPIIAADRFQQLIERLTVAEPIWIDNDRLRQEQFQQIVRECDTEEMLSLWRNLKVRRQVLGELGKKMRNSDERILQECERLLFQECAFVLRTTTEDAADHLHKIISE